MDLQAFILRNQYKTEPRESVPCSPEIANSVSDDSERVRLLTSADVCGNTSVVK